MSENSTANPEPVSLRLGRLPFRAVPSQGARLNAEALDAVPPTRHISDCGPDLAQTAESLVDQLSNLHSGPLVFHLVVRLGDAAIPALERLVRGPSQAIYHSRCLGVDALAAIATPEAVQALTRALGDSIAREVDPVSLEAEGVLVNHIAEHLTRFKTSEVTDALLAALRRRPYPYCAAALGLISDPRAIPLLIECLFDDAARAAATGALRKFGKGAVHGLMAAALERETIGGIEPPTRLLGRAAATKLLGECMTPGESNADILTVLRKAMNDAERPVRLEGALALARGGRTPDAEDAAAVLAISLDDPDWMSAQRTAEALSHLPSAGMLIVGIIRARTRSDADRRRRLRAVGVAGRMRLSPAVAGLRTLSSAADPKLRLAAISALGQIPSADAQSIARFLTDREPVIRQRALQALRRRHALTADSATRLLGDEDPGVRRLADASIREDLGAALPALHRAALHFGAPLKGWSSRLRLWWHAWLLLAAKSTRSDEGPRRGRA